MKLVLLFLLLAAPVLSSPLVGTWEIRSADEFGAGEIVLRMSLLEEGTLELEYDITFGDGMWSLVLIPYEEATGGNLPELPPFEVVGVRAPGTWVATADSFWIDSVGEQTITINGRDPLEYFTEVGRILARAVAEAQGVPEDDYPDFENAFIENFQDELVDSFFDFEDVSGDFEIVREAYEIEGDRLRLTDSDGETTEFLRVDDSGTAVRPASWGRVKSNMR